MEEHKSWFSLSRRPSAPAASSGINNATSGSSSTVLLPSATYKPEILTPRRAPPVSHIMMPERRWPMDVPALSSGAREHRNDRPVFADFDAPHFVIGGGVAIFHLASARVVLCWHTRDKYWFLPKGRRDAGEESGAGAEREGYEESGFRNRLLPLPLEHKQPQAAAVTVPLSPAGDEDPSLIRPSQARLCTEPVLTQLLPVTRHRQYLLQWYIAETVPPGVEARVNASTAQAAAARRVEKREVYVRPPPFPKDLTLRARIGQDCLPMDSDPSAGEDRKASIEPSNSPPDPNTIGIARETNTNEIPCNALGMEGVPIMPMNTTNTVTVRGAQFDMSPALMPGGWPQGSGRRWVANTEKVSAWTDSVEIAGGSPPLGALLGSAQPTPNIGAAMSPDPNAFAATTATKVEKHPSTTAANTAPAPASSSAPAAFNTPQPASSVWAAMHRAEAGLGVGMDEAIGVAQKDSKKIADLYTPLRHPNTGVDEEEALYTSELVTVEEAVRKLEGSGMERVVRIGWEAICRRWQEEEREDKAFNSSQKA